MVEWQRGVGCAISRVSELSLWFKKRFSEGGKRQRRIGIVALARRLLVTLWRYVDQGLVPQGAELKAWESQRATASIELIRS
ncbi:MAG: hypothetical protein ACRER2_06925 [Methylococcales bacterium]